MSPAEQAHMSKVIEKKQMQDFMKLYSGLVERCFMSCAQDFTSKALTGKEHLMERLPRVLQRNSDTVREE
ncbi:protein transporter tim9 [Naganishia friedmannii]|uniref:Protein transporter tim9 n=1 Tax=Naganishia friedmannii TaxID=89922 RepID=A0ACC2VNJ0_9TREE|nr:protein transporter tim9 [Naganishia friedmannii]